MRELEFVGRRYFTSMIIRTKLYTNGKGRPYWIICLDLNLLVKFSNNRNAKIFPKYILSPSGIDIKHGCTMYMFIQSAFIRDVSLKESCTDFPPFLGSSLPSVQGIHQRDKSIMYIKKKSVTCVNKERVDKTTFAFRWTHILFLKSLATFFNLCYLI